MDSNTTLKLLSGAAAVYSVQLLAVPDTWLAQGALDTNRQTRLVTRLLVGGTVTCGALAFQAIDAAADVQRVALSSAAAGLLAWGAVNAVELAAPEKPTQRVVDATVCLGLAALCIAALRQ